MTDIRTTTNRRTLLREALGAATLGTATLAASPSFAIGTKPAPIAKTMTGKVRGGYDSGIVMFKGVRYGADTRDCRFMAPQRPKSWSGVRDALAFGNACPQSQRIAEPTSEDCLFLNIWTPALRDGGLRPVMVYLHGGGYSNGSGAGANIDGTNLSKRGNVVVVTVNHRLNAFGYIYLGMIGGTEFADSGNVGQLDILLALHWIRENIAEFGGDPGTVMVFGQSGGGAKIATMMAMPAANGLFHRATTMSGQQTTAAGPLNATKRSEAYLKALGISRANLADIKTVATEKLVEALNVVDPVLGTRNVYFGPVLDMKNLLRHPFYPDAPAASAAIPMMIGNTREEMGGFIKEEWCRKLTWNELPDRLAQNMRVDILPSYVVEQYRQLFPNLTPDEAFIKIVTASRSWRAAIEENEARARSGCPAYAYQVDWPAAGDDGKMGAHHAIDVPLAFDNTDKPGMSTGNGEAARKMAAVVSETFIAFARTGNPNNPLIPEWKPYTLPNRETMLFDLPPHLENDPRGEQRRIFELVPFTLQGT
jgi:para-nitrobenzyl esterase